MAATAACSAGFCGQSLTLSLESPSLSSPAQKPPQPEQRKAAPSPRKDPPAAGVKIGRVGLVQAASASIYRAKSYTAPKFATVKVNTPLAVVKDEGGWYGVLMVNGAVGWIARDSVKMTGYELVAKKPATSRNDAVSRGGATARGGSFGDLLVRAALQYCGIPYVFGGRSVTSGMDCSAFVRMVFGQHGVSLPRTAREQAAVGQTVAFDLLQPGDRLYFSCKNPYIDHCGIYAGGGYFVHCSSSRGGVAVDSLASAFYWRSLVTAKRS